VKSEDPSHNPQAEVGDKSRDSFMEHQLIFSDPVISQVGNNAPEPIERLERQARSWAKFFEDMHRARWDIPVVQRAVDDTLGKEGWRGLLSGCRHQPLGETGNRARAGRSPGSGRVTLAEERQPAGVVQVSWRPGGVDNVRRAKSTPLHHLPGGLDSGKVLEKAHGKQS